MTSLVVYDSIYGNTEKIAQVIAKELQTKAVRINDISPDMLKNISLLVIGSPTSTYTASKIIIKFIKSLKRVDHHIEKVATFDTRIDIDKQNNMLDFMVKRFGNAIDAMNKHVVNIGFSKPESQYFYVLDTEGPLVEGAVQDAIIWANKLKS